MTHTPENLSKAIYIAEAVLLLIGGYLSVFRVHLRGRPETDDDVYLGGEHANALAAMADAAGMAAEFLRERGEW